MEIEEAEKAIAPLDGTREHKFAKVLVGILEELKHISKKLK